MTLACCWNLKVRSALFYSDVPADVMYTVYVTRRIRNNVNCSLQPLFRTLVLFIFSSIERTK